VLEKRTRNANEWIASPILASSHANLAPASIFTAEFDVLRSEGEAYNSKLKEAGTPSTYKMFPGVAHPFAHWEGVLDKSKEYVRDTLSVIRQAHSTPS
jgi:acetyl esterase/lipase